MLEPISQRLAEELDALSFEPPTSYVYNPLRYAWKAHQSYLRRYGGGLGRIVLLGMNPGPWGMAQTGVPFGEVAAVKDWMGIEAPVEKPRREHPKKPVHGFGCQRSEVSGARLWGWARARFGPAERFFERFFVWNYCPLLFLEDGGRNRTPDKLPGPEARALQALCDKALCDAVEALEPARVIGIGVYAESRAKQALVDRSVPIDRILHPSPASPAANRGWAGQAESQLRALGIELPKASVSWDSSV
ncbi:MAG: single-stranded DNA-binding protein [Myxococcota bacterium]